MKWLILPQKVVDNFVSNQNSVMILASIILEDLPSSFKIDLNERNFISGNSKDIVEDIRLMCLWIGNDKSPINLSDGLLSIWCDSEGFNIYSLDEEDIATFLKRIFMLSYYISNNEIFPKNWQAKKIEGHNSIYAGGMTLKNLRVPYIGRKVDNINILDIGCFYYARKQEKNARVPQFDPSILVDLPKIIEFPDDLENISDIIAIDESITKQQEEGDILIEGRKTNLHLFSLTYDQWTYQKGPLTKQQLKVIKHKIKKPLRIHGPAGSGKTLVLILKALYLLRESVERNKRCHLLFVVTSNAVKQTVKMAFETIDDRLFLATTQKDDQFLDVETLHGWCIRELGLEQNAKYVLEKDPKESKERQKVILEGVVNNAIEEKYDRIKNTLCKDFLKRIDNHRETLIKELQWEIAIRIKGRGFRTSDRDLYIKSPMKTFLGSKADIWDKHFIFYIYEKYEERFKEENLLDTDDVVLTMSATLSTSLWDRQRAELGYDYVFVDETHLFNDNERRVLPLLTKAETVYPYLAMTFDETQSIGGSRGLNLKNVGISKSERKNLKTVHRYSPDIFNLARDIIERSPLVFTEFLTEEKVSKMDKGELKRCIKPRLIYCSQNSLLVDTVVEISFKYKKSGYSKIGIILFDQAKYTQILKSLHKGEYPVFEISERGEMIGAVPKPGFYIMTPETCGGLEFDACFIVGADKGIVPIPLGDISREGYQSILEEAYMELYTSITRAKYVLLFVSDEIRGITDILKPAINRGLIEESNETVINAHRDRGTHR